MYYLHNFGRYYILQIPLSLIYTHNNHLHYLIAFINLLLQSRKCKFARKDKIYNFVVIKHTLQSNISCSLRYLEIFAANDIQSRCRNLREMKDVFK